MHATATRAEGGAALGRKGAHDVLLRRREARVKQVLVRHVVDTHAQVGAGTEVDELEAARREDHVLRLDVAVHDARAVDGLQVAYDVLHHHLRARLPLAMRCVPQAKYRGAGARYLRWDAPLQQMSHIACAQCCGAES